MKLHMPASDVKGLASKDVSSGGLVDGVPNEIHHCARRQTDSQKFTAVIGQAQSDRVAPGDCGVVVRGDHTMQRVASHGDDLKRLPDMFE